MFRLKISHLPLFLALISPACGMASVCVATDGGFGHGGTTFVGTGYSIPSEGKCTPWSGFTKTASTVILTTGGTGCLSSDGKAFTLSVSSADPAYTSHSFEDYITFSRSSTSHSFTSGNDNGEFSGSANMVSCSSSLLSLPSSHD